MGFKKRVGITAVLAMMFSLVMLVSHLTAINAGTAAVTINTGTVTNAAIGGFGFQMDPFFWRADNRSAGIDQASINQSIAKGWKELSPGFARVYIGPSWWEPTEGTKNWNSPEMLALYKDLDILKANGTEVFLSMWYHTTVPSWLGDGYTITDPVVLGKLAKTLVDGFDYLINTKGYTNIHYFVIANELQTKNCWNCLSMTDFKAHHQAIANEMAARGKSNLIKLASTDETSGTSTPGTLSWAAANMDNITGAYESHHYESASYATVKTLYDSLVAISKPKGKPSIVGEFGGSGSVWDETNKDLGSNGMQIAERPIAALNAGIYALSKWTFVDMKYTDDGSNPMTWGAMSGVDAGFTNRPVYDSYGLMTKFFRPNSKSFSVTSNDSNVNAAAVKNNANAKYTVAVSNRNTTNTTITYTFSGDSTLSTTLRKYVYNPNSLPTTIDLPASVGTVSVSGGVFSDTVLAGTLAVYVQDYVTTAPSTPGGLSASSKLNKASLSWTSNTESDLAYYRVYRSTTSGFTPSLTNQVGSSITNSFTDKNIANGTYYYKISAVNNSGNESGFSAQTSTAVSFSTVNLALNKTTMVSNYFQNNATYNGSKAVDGNATTRWATDAGITSATLDIDFGTNVTFNRTLLKECTDFGQRIRSYKIQYWNGSSWVDAYTGGTPSASQMDSFPAVTASKVRLNITSTIVEGGPTIWEFEVYSDAGGSQTTVAIPNADFEADSAGSQTITNWTTWCGPSGTDCTADYIESGGYNGTKNAVHYKATPYEVSTYQTINSLANGTYNVSVWVKSNLGTSGQAASQLQLSADNGSTWAQLDLPPANYTTWTQVFSTMNVTNGSLTIALHTKDVAGGYWIRFDNVTASKQ